MREAPPETSPSAPVVPKSSPPSRPQDSDLNSSGDEEALAWIGREISRQSAAATPYKIQQFNHNRGESSLGVNDVTMGTPIAHVGQEMPSPQEEMSAPQPTTQATAGKNSNPYNLPHSTLTDNNMVVVGTAASLESGVVSNPQFRPCL